MTFSKTTFTDGTSPKVGATWLNTLQDWLLAHKTQHAPGGTDTVFPTNSAGYLKNDGSGNLSYDNPAGTGMPNPFYDYLELYASDADLPATDPLGANPPEGMVDIKTTTVNGNRFVYGRFTDGGTEDLQWFKHFKPDWNGDDATLGKVSFMVIWTADSGAGTFKFDLAGKLLGNDDATDTALAAIGSITDTLITAGDWHYSPWSTPALISALTTGGKSAFFKGIRDSANDTLNATARVSGVIVKYIRTGAY